MPDLEAGDGALVLEDVRKEYESVGPVLRGISLRVSRGETVAIRGPSGCGKSTLLNIIGSLDKPSSGAVRLGPTDVTALAGPELAEYRSRRVGFIFQDHHLLPQCTAVENVVLPSLALSDGREEAGDRAEPLLDRVGLKDRMAAFPSELSGGERQRVAIARAMLNAPEVLLCDEPTGNLDEETGDRITDLFLEMAAENSAMLILVTHDARVAGRLGRRLRLEDGRLGEEA